MAKKSRSDDRSPGNSGIQANNVRAEVLAVGDGARAIQHRIVTSGVDASGRDAEIAGLLSRLEVELRSLDPSRSIVALLEKRRDVVEAAQEALQMLLAGGESEISSHSATATLRHRLQHLVGAEPDRERDPASVFISYSHEDANWLDRLLVHLAPLARAGVVDVWSDRHLRAGEDWRQEISAAVRRSRVAVLLVTPSFLASEFIANHELPPILQGARELDTQVIWVPIAASSYAETEIEQLHAAHDPAAPLASLSEAAQDAAFVDVCRQIKAAAGR